MASMERAHESCIPEPTYCRLKQKIKPALSAKLDRLQNVITSFLSSQQQQEKMMSEAKLLHIMIYKRNRQLRQEKSLQLLKRVQACLKRASTFGRLFTLTDDIQKDLHSAVAEMKESKTVYLPAQQTWSYMLYLQMQYIKLLDTNASFCIIAFKHLSCQLSSGMLIPQMIVFMAIVARIWLLSRGITEKIQSCYSTIFSLRQHIDRTNSDWKDPVLPPQLQLDNTHEVKTDLKAMLDTVSEVPVTESMEVVQEQQHRKVIQKIAFPSLDEIGEDIGVPVVMKRPVVAESRDSTNSRRENTGANEIKKNCPTNDDTVKRGVSGEVSPDLTTTGTPTWKMKKKKRKLEGLDINKPRPKKIKSYSSDNVKTDAKVWSLKTQDMHDIEQCHSDQELHSAADHRRSKKHKKMEEVKLSKRHLCTDNVDSGSSVAVKNRKKLKKKNKMRNKNVHKMDNLETKNKHEVKKAKAIVKIKKKKLFVAP